MEASIVLSYYFILFFLNTLNLNQVHSAFFQTLSWFNVRRLAFQVFLLGKLQRRVTIVQSKALESKLFTWET